VADPELKATFWALVMTKHLVGWLQNLFLQNSWHLIDADICELIKDLFTKRKTLKGLKGVYNLGTHMPMVFIFQIQTFFT